MEARVACLERMIFGQKSKKCIHEFEEQLGLKFGGEFTK
jgi:hypothetical protein